MRNPFDTPLFITSAPALFVVLWSTGYVGARFGLPYADPMTLVSIRFAIVALLLILMGKILKVPFPGSLSTYFHLAVSGFLIHSCFIGGFFLAMDSGVNIGIAALIAGVQPLLTAIIAVFFLNERLSLKEWSGFVLGFLGLVLVVLESFQLAGMTPTGFIYCVVGLFGITFGTVYQKRFVTGVNLFTGSAVQFTAALFPCMVWSLIYEPGHVEWNLTVALALVWLCLVMSIGAISILLFLIRRGAAARVSSLFYLVAPATALQGYWFFDEHLSPAQLFGVGVTVLGVALIGNVTEESLSETD